MLDIKDLEKGDELICIDRDGYIKKDNGNPCIRRHILSKPIIVLRIAETGVLLDGGGLQIPLDALVYFKKKERSQYTFDDLIDVAVQAYKDGISTIKIDTKIHTVFVEELRTTYGVGHIDLGIKEIKSLYKETFVIECEEDITRIKSGAVITLQNGNTVSVVIATNYTVCNAIKVDDWQCYLEFVSLKGATVEQPK